ncbi:MAG: protein translocase subunit SecF, partial [Acidimicrobiales bacterium]
MSRRGRSTGNDHVEVAGDGEDVGDLDGHAPVPAELDQEALDQQRQEELAEEKVERRAVRAGRGRGDRRPGPLRRLYRGETSFPFVERRRRWLLISAVVILAGVVSLGVRGLNLGITFKGGTAWSVPAAGVTQVQATSAVQAAGVSQPTVELLGTGGRQHLQVQADLNALSSSQQKAETARVIHALAHLAHVAPQVVSVTHVGPTWGGQVTNRAVIALIVFLVLVAVYISIRFEPKMAVAAFVALLHDLLVTAGVYSLAGFQVTPDTVIAVLTILGYSLYDTVVVFDRVRDNAKGLGSSGRITYSEMVDLSMNQTLARSVNTSLVAILPVLAVLLIGAELLGATTLQNYGLALVVGLLSGAYSSIFIASPILAILKEREPRYIAMRQRIESKGERLGRLTPMAAAALATSGGGAVANRSGGRDGGKSTPARPGTLRPD